MQFKSFFTATVIVVGIFFSDVAVALNYTLTELGSLGGSYSIAYGINNNGQITGVSNTVGNSQTHAFIWSNGVMSDLGIKEGGSYSWGKGINDSGQIVGVVGSPHSTALWNNGVLSEQEWVDTVFTSEAMAINNSGSFVGGYVPLNAVEGHAFLSIDGFYLDLGTLGGARSSAYSINDLGQVVGYSHTLGNSSVHPVLWENGVIIDLNPLGGVSYATSINNFGQIVGMGDLGPTLWENGNSLFLGNIGAPKDINNLGQIVGDNYLWDNGAITDLNAYVTDLGWYIKEATGINDNGWIVGYGTNQVGQTSAFLLTPDTTQPVPEPSTFLMLGAGFIGLWIHRRRFLKLV